MNLKRPAFFFGLAILLSGLAACGRSPDCFSEKVFCAGLVTNTSGIKDHGLNQHAWEGLQQALKDKTLDYAAYIESVDARDYGKNIQTFVQDGYDVIITVGPAMDDETLHAADAYPNPIFMGIDQPQRETRPNLLPIVFAEDQMGFWAGALAAHVTQTGTIGAVCETSSLDSMWRYCEGFRKGAAYVDKDVKALVVYRENQSSDRLFIDEDWGHATAQTLIQRGADVIFAAGGGTAQGALRAAAESRVRAIGAERDQAQALPEASRAMITSVYGGAGSEVQKWMRLIRSRNVWEGNQIGAFVHAPYSEFESQVSESLKTEMDKLLMTLVTGGLKTEVSQKAP